MRVCEHSERNFDKVDVHKVDSSVSTKRYGRFFKLGIEPNSRSQILPCYPVLLTLYCNLYYAILSSSRCRCCYC